MVSFSTARHHKGSRLKRGVNKRLTGLLSGHLSLGSASQCSRRHLEYRAAAVRPFAVRKASRCLPNGVDQASFAGFVEGDANRPIEVDMFHHCAEHLPRIEVPNITASAAYLLRFMSLAGTRSTSPMKMPASFAAARNARRASSVSPAPSSAARHAWRASRALSLSLVSGGHSYMSHSAASRALLMLQTSPARSPCTHTPWSKGLSSSVDMEAISNRAAGFDATAAGWFRASKRIATRAILTTGAASAVAQQHAGLTGGFDELCPDIMAGTRTRQRIT
jgi:hypothetical protein